MTKLWAFVRHNSGIIIGSILCIFTLVWVYGCPSKVTSITDPPKLVSRPELEAEVDYFLQMTEIRFAELDQQDEFKRTIFAMAMGFIDGGSINPAAIFLVLGNLIGVGAVVDNVRKRTVINTLKNQNANEKTV